MFNCMFVSGGRGYGCHMCQFNAALPGPGERFFVGGGRVPSEEKCQEEGEGRGWLRPDSCKERRCHVKK